MDGCRLIFSYILAIDLPCDYLTQLTKTTLFVVGHHLLGILRQVYKSVDLMKELLASVHRLGI